VEFGIIDRSLLKLPVWIHAIKQYAKKHMLCPVQRFVLTADLGQGYKRNKSLLTV